MRDGLYHIRAVACAAALFFLTTPRLDSSSQMDFFSTPTGFFETIIAAGRSKKQFMMLFKVKKGSAADYLHADRREQRNATFHKSTHCVYSRPLDGVIILNLVQKFI